MINLQRPAMLGTFTLALALLAGCSGGDAPSSTASSEPTASEAAAPSTANEGRRIRIVGSSTVFPFSSYVAEEFGATTGYPSPVVESTGSGGGHKLFTEGVGSTTPDLTNSSRRMKVSEFERAAENEVGGITEAIIGYDGIAVAQSASNDPVDFTIEQIALAVAKEVPVDGQLVANPYKKWNEIDPSLPDREIVIYGPPTSSGTRDAFEELCMGVATENIEGYGGEYTAIREDGVYVPAGENDNLIVQRIEKDADAFGIFGYSFLTENSEKISGSHVNGVAPEPENISDGTYPLSRSLYFYIKHAHADEVPGMKEFVSLFMGESMIGERGYLTDIGLIPLPKEMREAARKRVEDLSPLKLIDGELSSIEDYMAGNE